MSDLIQQLSRLIAENLQSDPNATIEQLVERLKADARISQINQGNGLAFQTLVKEGGIANIGIHLHDFDEDKLDKVLKAFWQSLQPQGIPNNVLRSSAANFIGRESELAQLHKHLQQGNLVSIFAVEGMGGVGKTELAIQYAQKYESFYPGGICWLFGRESDLGTQVVGFAQSQLNLKIPEGLEFADRVAFCWRNWRQGDVLLVIDDVVDYSKVNPYLPPVTSNRFKVVMTTRLKFGQPIQSLALDVFTPEQSLESLKSFIGKARIEKEPDNAAQLCKWLGYLPLGLELVGRYLGKEPDLTLQKMLERLNKKRLQHQSLREPDATMTRQLGVAAAIELSWERLNEPSQHLGCLLSLFALAPIPWRQVELSAQNIASLPEDEEDLEEARRKLIELHLLNRIDEGTYLLHQLIREFLQDKLGFLPQSDEFKQAFAGAIASVAREIPDTPILQEIESKRLVIPHIEEVADNLTEFLSDEDLIWPFLGLGRFYEGQGIYGVAEPWRKKSLDITKARFGSEHLAVATSINNLAGLYKSQGRYTEAEPLYVQALTMRKQLLGASHPDVAASIHNLASLYKSQGRYTEAEPLYVQALTMYKQLLGESHPLVATSIHNLAGLYNSQGRYTEAEPLYIQALTMRKQLLGASHPDVASSINNLANLYNSQGRYTEAEPLYIQALTMYKQLLGESHPDVATSINNLAALYKSQGRYTEAESLYVQALTMKKQLLGESHPSVATSINNLAFLYKSQGRYTEAEPLYVQALAIFEQSLGIDHPNTVICRKNLADCRHAITNLDGIE